MPIAFLDGTEKLAVANYEGTMFELLHRYKQVILDASESNLRADPTLGGKLEIDRVETLSVNYAPFEHIERGARLVLVGITPGSVQAANALIALRSAVRSGFDDASALARAKVHASFSGPMRSNLVNLLDFLGVNRWLDISTTADLWGGSSQMVHFTSALRNPVFTAGKNYSGTPSIAKTALLKQCVQHWLAEEAKALPEAVWVPLGPTALDGLSLLIQNGTLDSTRVLAGLPHPSGANAERIAYFLERKRRELLSSKTNPIVIDGLRDKLTAQVTALLS